MREERIELSQGERDRLKVLHHVEQGYLTRAEAGQQNPKPKRKYIPPPHHPWRRTFLLRIDTQCFDSGIFESSRPLRQGHGFRMCGNDCVERGEGVAPCET